MDKIYLNVYADEVLGQTMVHQDKDNESWLYSGILLINRFQEDKIIHGLNELRCPNRNKPGLWNECPHECEKHKKNDKEVHYSDLNKGDVYQIAKKWLPSIVSNEEIYISILGINKTKLKHNLFGKDPNDRNETIYNRFFRTLLKGAINYFFKDYDTVVVSNIIHDNNTSLQSHKYFTHHVIKKIESENKNIRFEKERVIFLDSDHRKSKDKRSNLIQVIDLVLGLTTNCIHFNSKEGNHKFVLSTKFIPTFENIMNRKSSINNKHMLISFFPLNSSNSEIHLNNFYKNRKLLIKQEPTLFENDFFFAETRG